MNDHVKELIKMYRSGIKPKEISLKFGITRGTVFSHLNRYAPHLVKRRNRISKLQAIKMYQKGHSLSEIAAKYGVTRQAAAYIIKTHSNLMRSRREGHSLYYKKVAGLE